MKLSKKGSKILKWTVRIFALAILMLGLPFYFGYGNPLPFANPDNTIMDNIWLSTFPLMFIGLALGWRYEKIGGFLITIPIVIATVLSIIIIKEGLPGPMFIPMIAGILYLLSGFKDQIFR